MLDSSKTRKLPPTVRSQEAAKGIATAARTLLRPHRMASPEGTPPKNAPSRLREATQEPSAGVMEKEAAENGEEVLACMDASAGEE